MSTQMQPDVPDGYKLTEVGVIPRDWNVLPLSKHMKLLNGYGFKPSQWSQHGIPIIRIQNLNDAKAESNYFEGTIDQKFHVKKGDLLFAWSGSKGSSFGARVWKGQPAVLNQHIFRVVPDKNYITDKYAYLVLRKVQEEVEKMAHGFKSSFVHVKKSDLNKTLLPIPPKKEQVAIAEMLTDVDALISSLEKIIAKKRVIKTAAMQQLLTGKKRLPPFDKNHTGYKQTELGEIPEDWETKRIAELADVIRGASPRPKGDKRYYGGTVPRLMVQDVTRDGMYVTPRIDFLTEEGAKLSRPCIKETLTLVCSGTVGVPSILAVDACIHDGFLGLVKLNKNISRDYLYQFFKTQKEKFDNAATHGGVFTNLTTDGVREFLVPVPATIEEQDAIATALTTMDRDIILLEERLTKTKQLKQGMMQELLTGKTRLIAGTA